MASKALILIEGHRGMGPLYVREAQRRGLHPITMSTDPTQYDYLGAEGIEAVQVDTNDLDAMKSVYSRLKLTHDIAGLTGFSGLDESVYVTVGKLCRHFGLPGPDPASIKQCHDKFTQRQRLEHAGVPIPDYRVATNAAEVESAVAEIGFPVVIKPIVGSGSIGVQMCRTVDEVAEHTKHLLGGGHMWQSSPRILVEEFAQGAHYIVHTMGDEVIGIEAADFDRPPHFVFRGSVFPAVLTSEEHKRIADVALSCLRALGLGWGPANTELRWTKRGPVVIEVNPRLAGDPELVQLAYGIDLVTEHIKLVIGETGDLRRRGSQTAAFRNLLPDRDGTLDWIRGTSRAAAIPGVVEVKLYVEPNTTIVRKGDYQDSIGHVIVTSPSHALTEAILQRAVDLISWSITPFDE